MKKVFVKILAAFLAAMSVFGLVACGNDGNSSSSGNGEKADLMPIEPAAIGTLGYDYYLAAEPAASAKVKASKNSDKPLYIVADLQKLYGGTNGYPQAVLVVKNTFLEANGAWVKSFIADVKDAATWLTAETTEIETIVTAVSSCLTEGLTPSFNKNNLTKDVIGRCGVYFTGAQEGKAEVNAFLAEMIGVSAGSAKTVADKFFYSNSSSSGNDETVTASVYMPDGAPALSMAKLMSEKKDGVAFNVVDASTISTFVTGENPKADLCVLPLNAASKLLGTGETYTMLGTVTHGNLYLLSHDETETFESGTDLGRLAGKTIGTIQINNVPGLTLKLLLGKNGVEYFQYVGQDA